ncbi:PREDICTED: SH3 domain-containing protein C23A1.17-like [Atta cephalotes]|uniref:Uncharacterized protein n=1 Tax=Atta cephalotes TaxID=12957 RepID=A0A158NMC0_ATTCE|nr:PREDICTED: SH3 domain-containing protein C23A1.17-like [Atta cephalotes]
MVNPIIICPDVASKRPYPRRVWPDLSFRGHIWAEVNLIYHIRVSGQTPEMPPATPRPSGVIKCTPESPHPKTRLPMVAELSHRHPGLPEITPERTSLPPRPTDVTTLTLKSQGVAGLIPVMPLPITRPSGVAGLTSEEPLPPPSPPGMVGLTIERQPPVPMPMGVAEYTSMPPEENTQKANPITQAIGSGRTYSRGVAGFIPRHPGIAEHTSKRTPQPPRTRRCLDLPPDHEGGRLTERPGPVPRPTRVVEFIPEKKPPTPSPPEVAGINPERSLPFPDP